MKGYIQGLITGISIMSLMMFNSCENQQMEYRARTTLQAVEDILRKVSYLEEIIVEGNDYHYRNTKILKDIENNQIDEIKMTMLLDYGTIGEYEMKNLLKKYCD
tara:strand:- start:842 stop:1153 length:312 start_codon:yes stop_codon:yes gene_type:complete